MVGNDSLIVTYAHCTQCSSRSQVPSFDLIAFNPRSLGSISHSYLERKPEIRLSVIESSLWNLEVGYALICFLHLSEVVGRVQMMITVQHESNLLTSSGGQSQNNHVFFFTYNTSLQL
jgi:hypothetical protein